MSATLNDIHFKIFQDKVEGLIRAFKTSNNPDDPVIKKEFKEVCEYFEQPSKVTSASDYIGGMNQFRSDNAAELFMIGMRLNKMNVPARFLTTSHTEQQAIVLKLKTVVEKYKIKQAYSQIRNGKKFIKAGLEQRDTDHPIGQKNAIKKYSEANIRNLIDQLKKEHTNNYGILKEEEELFSILNDPKYYHLQHATNHFFPILNAGSLNSYTEIQRNDENFTSAFSTKGNIDKLGNGGFVFFRSFFEGVNGDNTRYGESKLVTNIALLQKEGWISLHDQLKPAPTKAPSGSSDPTSISKYFRWDGTILRKMQAVNIENDTVDPALKDGIEYSYKIDPFKPNETQLKKVESRVISFTDEIFYGKDIVLGIALSAINELRFLQKCGFRQHFLKLIKDSNEAQKLEHIGNLIKGLFRIEGKFPVAVKLEEDPETESYSIKPFGETIADEKTRVELDVTKPEGDGRYNKDLSVNPEHMELAKSKERFKKVNDDIPNKRKQLGRFKENAEKAAKYEKELKDLTEESATLLNNIAASNVERENLIKYFEEKLEVDRADILKVSFQKLFLIKEEFSDLLENSETLTFEELADTPIEKLQYLINTENYKTIIMDENINFNELKKYTIKELKKLEDYDLSVAISEKGVALDTLFKLHRKNPVHLDCLCTEDIGQLINDLAPKVDPLVMKYAKEEESDGNGRELEEILEEVTENLQGRDKQLFQQNLKKWYSKQSDYQEKMDEVHSSYNFLCREFPDIFPDEDSISDEVSYFQKLFFPETVADEESEQPDNDDDYIDSNNINISNTTSSSSSSSSSSKPLVNQYHQTLAHKRKSEKEDDDTLLQTNDEPLRKKIKT